MLALRERKRRRTCELQEIINKLINAMVMRALPGHLSPSPRDIVHQLTHGHQKTIIISFAIPLAECFAKRGAGGVPTLFGISMGFRTS